MKNRNGQVIIILLFFIPPLLFLLFSVANVTLAVRDRVKLQNSADATALSAAAWQAKGLNQLAEANTLITTIDLIEKHIRKESRSPAKTNARLLLLEAERRRMIYVKGDVLKRLPGYAKKSAEQNGMAVLTGMFTGGNKDMGAGVFGVRRDLALSLGVDGDVDAQRNRIFAVAWRKRPLAGVASHLYGQMAVPPGFALASAGAQTVKNEAGQMALIPDFKPELIHVRLSQQDFDYLKNNYYSIMGRADYHDLSTNILH